MANRQQEAWLTIQFIRVLPMNESFAHSYSTLGLKPGSSWNEIRSRYRSLIKKWHPDRFQQDGKKHRLAEEKTREITRAYKTLADYYRKHGSTPTHPVPVPVPAAATRSPETAASVPASTAQAGPSPHTPVEATGGLTFFILTVIAVLLALWWWEDPVDHQGINTQPLPNNASQEVARPAAGDNTTSHPADQFFTLGSKLGEVYAIQGVPSKTEQGVWYYGKSRVYFVDGSVSRWDSHPDNPLRASLDIDPVVTKKTFIQRGSTKDDVRALHGTPWRQTEREWTYGSSRIFFSGDVVTGWEESTLNPLKLQR